MKNRLIIATILLFIAAIIHCIGGELTDINSLMNSSIAQNLKIEIRAVWYLVAIDFFVSGIYLVFIIQKGIMNKNILLINFIGFRMLLYGITFLILILYINSELLFSIPQWILLLIIGILLEWNIFLKMIK